MGCLKSKPVISLEKNDLTVVMLTTPDRFEFSSLTIKRMKMYCKLHNYSLVVYENVLEMNRAAPWSKIVALQKVLNESKTEFVVWIDDDIWVTNPFVSLSKLIEKTIGDNNLLVSEDAQKHKGYPINTGVMILRRGDWSKEYLDLVWDEGKSMAKECYWEQSTMTDLLWKAPEFTTKIAILPMPVLQSFYRYPETQDPEHCTWSGSHFLCHLTGLPKDVRIDMVKHLEKQGLFPMVRPPFKKMNFQQMVETQEKELERINH